MPHRAVVEVQAGDDRIAFDSRGLDELLLLVEVDDSAVFHRNGDLFDFSHWGFLSGW